jgi:hypothetical protein
LFDVAGRTIAQPHDVLTLRLQCKMSVERRDSENSRRRYAERSCDKG